MPNARDASLICTNLRLMGGKRPIFADHADSVFVFPVGHIRFIEVPSASIASASPDSDPAHAETALALPAPREEPETDLEIDEDFLRRVRDA
jgi:hypothetical protein